MDITWQEIRDIIEANVRVRSGTILGASAAARVIMLLVEREGRREVRIESAIDAGRIPDDLEAIEFEQEWGE